MRMTWGKVWVPNEVPRGCRPYTMGRWAYSGGYGWYWVSKRLGGGSSSRLLQYRLRNFQEFFQVKEGQRLAVTRRYQNIEGIMNVDTLRTALLWAVSAA